MIERLHRVLGPTKRGAIFYLLYWSVVNIYEPFINAFFDQIGLTGRQIGLLSTLLPFATFLAGPALSALADSRGWRRRVLAATLAGMTVTLFFVGIPRTFLGLLPLMVLLALFRGPVLPLADSLISRMAMRHGVAYGGMRLWGSMGAALVALLCGVVWQRLGYDPMFTVSAVLFVLVIPAVFLLEELPRAQGSAAQKPVRRIVRDPGVLALLAGTLLTGVGQQTSWIFGSVHINELGGGQFTVGLLFGLSVIFELPSLFFGDRLVDRLGGAWTLILAYGLSAASVATYALAPNATLLLLSGPTQGLGFGLMLVSSVRLLNERVPEAWSSTVQSLRTASFALASVFVGVLGGGVYDLWGHVALFTGGAVVIGLAMLVLFVAETNGWLHERHTALFAGASLEE